MKVLNVLALAAFASFALAAPALAQEIAYGDAIADVGASVVEPVKTTLTLVIMAVVLKYAGPFGMLIRQNFVADLVGKAVDFAFAATLGAQRGKTLSAEQMPEFLRNVVSYANGHFPWVLRFVIKNVRGLVEKALARMVNELPAEFQYSPSLIAQIEHETGGVRQVRAPISAALSKINLV